MNREGLIVTVPANRWLARGGGENNERKVEGFPGAEAANGNYYTTGNRTVNQAYGINRIVTQLRP